MRLSNFLVGSSALIGLALVGRSIFTKQSLADEFLSDADYDIRELAYQIWESEGRPEGEAERHWEMALKLSRNLSGDA